MGCRLCKSMKLLGLASDLTDSSSLVAQRLVISKVIFTKHVCYPLGCESNGSMKPTLAAG
jgi:hypothetical protein